MTHPYKKGTIMRTKLVQFKDKTKNYYVMHDLEFMAAGGSALALALAYFFGKARGTNTLNVFVASPENPDEPKLAHSITDE